MKDCIVVFGAGGQVGSELMTLASRRGSNFRGLSRAEADITDATALHKVFEEFKPALAINCAAYTAVDRAEIEYQLANTVNAKSAGLVAAACASAKVPLIHISTDYVFDGKKNSAYTEADKPSPINAYGVSKAEGERLVRAALTNHVILRISWVYGVYGNNFLKSILRLARERDELRIVEDQFGCPTSTTDIGHAILMVCDSLLARTKVSGTYHFAGTGRTSWFDFACQIVAEQEVFTGRDPIVTRISTREFPTAARRPMNSELDSGLFRSTFGYSAKPWQERTAETVAALLATQADPP